MVEQRTVEGVVHRNEPTWYRLIGRKGGKTLN